MSSQTLYRFYSSADELLYVGITARPWERWKKHRQEKPWWTEVAHIRLELFPSRDSVLKAERSAIITEKPRYNLMHNQPTKPPANGRVQVDGERLIWFCCQCQEPITDPTQGLLQVDETAARRRTDAAKDIYRDDSPGSFKIVDFTKVFALPEEPKWQAMHMACDPDPGELQVSAYWFALDRISTLRQALGWTAHLIEKDWIEHTDWATLLRVIAGREANA